ncbi:MAG: FN3 associated domain-containing protein, partial [Flavitalea sp.]
GLSLPAWLQVMGRIHPLLLHIPIGLLLLYAISELFFSFKKLGDGLTDLKDGLLLLGTVTISLTALMGLFLSREPGYEPDAISPHKWAGSLICFMLLAWYQWRGAIRKYAIINKSFAALSIILVTLTGHFGGNITHGENFVLAPILPKEETAIKVPLDEAVVFRHMVQPILKAKCVSCHNEKKAKGELVMESAELLIKGGKNGKLWDTTANDLGMMLKRVHLPLEHDDHMPPKGKPQLTDTEITILESWIRSGSNLTIKVSELPETDTLKVLAAVLFSSGDEEEYTFPEANQATIASLNNFYRVVQPIAAKSPALTVNFYGRSQFEIKALQELKPVSTQVVEIDLSRMPVKDEQLHELEAFPNLRKLILNFTDIKGKGLEGLSKLKFLRELSLSGTGVEASALAGLKNFPALKEVFLWNTTVSANEAKALQKPGGKVNFETGYVNDTMVLKLTPPICNNESFVITEPTELKLKHNINGAEIRYTLDGSEPDSIHAPIYHNDVKIEKSAVVKTKVFRKGWISSDVQVSNFYWSAAKPKKVTLLVQPDPYYPARREKTLFDFTLGGSSIGSGKWLGYHSPNNFDALMEFEAPVTASSITLSCLRNNDRKAFPPESVTIWYGDDSGQLKKMTTTHVSPPAKEGDESSAALVFPLPKEAFRYLRLQAVPVSKMPQWHSEKGKPGSLFIDELVIN